MRWAEMGLAGPICRDYKRVCNSARVLNLPVTTFVNHGLQVNFQRVENLSALVICRNSQRVVNLSRRYRTALSDLNRCSYFHHGGNSVSARAAIGNILPICAAGVALSPLK